MMSQCSGWRKVPQLVCIQRTNGGTSHEEVHVGIGLPNSKDLGRSNQYHIHVARGNLVIGQQPHLSYQIHVVKFNVIFVVLFGFIP